MNGGPTPLASIPLRDGTTLQIAPDAVRNGDRTFELAAIQDARQVSPKPETIALRVAGAGLVEFQPERPGDGAVALEALFHLRPDLRPAGFGTPPGMPGGVYPPPPPGYPTYPSNPPYPGYPPMPPYPPYGMPPIPPYAPPPPGFVPPGYAETQVLMERRARGLLTPFPRSFGETLAAIFHLYGSKFSTWLLLGLCVALVTGIISGGISYLIFKIEGLNNNLFPTTTVSSTGSFTSPYPFETGDALLHDLIILGILLLLSIVFGAWQTAVLSIGARDAILGRPVSVGASVAGGFRRLLPTLATSFLIGLLIFLALIPAIMSFVVLSIGTASLANKASDSSGAAILLIGALLTCAFSVASVVLVFLFEVRLGLSATAAATANIGPVEAIKRSWRITRGHFWYIFGIILIINLLVGVVSFIGGLSDGISPIVGYFIITPIILVFTAPFQAIMYTMLLYDMRLRDEGYASLSQEQAIPPQQPAAPGTVPPLG